ncbi:MAG: hypothetical protein J6S67_07190 [Methanobrevibacter sp.]|nr:hypothetical protein [Methanobrevibacter sp.]
MKNITIKDIVQSYEKELGEWDFFSDSQRAYLTQDNHIIVCLRNYNNYITKNEIKNELECIQALFEIDWIAEYDDEGDIRFIDTSKYWKEL